MFDPKTDTKAIIDGKQVIIEGMPTIPWTDKLPEYTSVNGWLVAKTEPFPPLPAGY